MELRSLTLIVFAVQMCGMAPVHPPAGAILQSAVVIEPVVIVVKGAELHAIVGRVELVAGVVAKVVAGESISGITAKVEPVHQTVLVGLGSDFEHVVVGIPGEGPQREFVFGDFFLSSRGSYLPIEPVCSQLT